MLCHSTLPVCWRESSFYGRVLSAVTCRSSVSSLRRGTHLHGPFQLAPRGFAVEGDFDVGCWPRARDLINTTRRSCSKKFVALRRAFRTRTPVLGRCHRCRLKQPSKVGCSQAFCMPLAQKWKEHNGALPTQMFLAGSTLPFATAHMTQLNSWRVYAQACSPSHSLVMKDTSVHLVVSAVCSMAHKVPCRMSILYQYNMYTCTVPCWVCVADSIPLHTYTGSYS